MTVPPTATHQPWPGVIAAYRDRLPVGDDWTPVTLLEGGTPLIAATNLSKQTGCTIHLKVEGLNPTGSFKDRGMTMAVTDALAHGQRAVLCASTGNTSASAAAYAARAGITCAVLIPQGKIAMGKLAQAVMHGAKIIQIDGNFDDCLELARKMAADFPTISLVNSVNPVRIEGQKTAAFEIVDVLGTAPDVHALPVGNAGNITAYWKGYTEYHQLGLIDKLPRMLGTQAAGAAPLVLGEPVSHPETIATAIRIGSPASWTSAVEAQQQSKGRFLAASDEEILAAYHLVARVEGVFVEPASAASIAGLLKAIDDGWVARGSTVVCTVTGNGLKDPDTALKDMPSVSPVPVDPVAVVEKLGLAWWRSQARRSRVRRVGTHGDSSIVAFWAGGQCGGGGVQCKPGPGLRQCRFGAESLRRDHRRDNRFRLDGDCRRRGRRPGAAGPRAPRGPRRAARVTGSGGQRRRPGGALPQRHPALPRPRLLRGSSCGRSCGR
ncbi:threonine synthase [Mycobacterium tuberculosis]|nr:threonine synthase [Mycobacterium tuberculosis]CKS48560.1 threonine synthase [Mycobacterium tuberculosis]CKU16849.1 threonine synthase [Mycobacterium tuberculosis]CKU49089.1 threonine synthase [Mycobacterium tuberculosis]